MRLKQLTLAHWQAIAAISGSLALPVVLAIIGYFLQQQLSEAGIKKDYVQTAVGILKEPPSEHAKELRAWAIKVLDANSPIPLSESVKAELTLVPISNLAFMPRFPEDCMQEPFKDIFDPPLAAFYSKASEDQFVILAEAQRRGELNRAKLECLQELIRKGREAMGFVGRVEPGKSLDKSDSAKK